VALFLNKEEQMILVDQSKFRVSALSPLIQVMLKVAKELIILTING